MFVEFFSLGSMYLNSVSSVQLVNIPSASSSSGVFPVKDCRFLQSRNIYFPESNDGRFMSKE